MKDSTFKLLVRIDGWFDLHYQRAADIFMFVFYICFGLSLAYSPPADSIVFLRNLFRGIDHRVIAYLFFILPSPVYLLKGYYFFKFLGLVPLGFLLSAVSWFLLITPNRSWFSIPIYALVVLQGCWRYGKLIIREALH